ncbi:hypothetical protein [Moorena sp. SIO3I8]|uniref:hypothetical protein n=1 Tax=Moorena sp. SIO3I8 TaxID=2607833 RepID=UPI0013C27323|nr:hypothetical protein [Moorena sp. SIO3I8]NEO10698.1 hypothetical protein [Moorena sp. SIO3I8]
MVRIFDAIFPNPDSRLPVPFYSVSRTHEVHIIFSLFPLPFSLFPYPLLPAPCSLLPKNPKFVPHKS